MCNGSVSGGRRSRRLRIKGAQPLPQALGNQHPQFWAPHILFSEWSLQLLVKTSREGPHLASAAWCSSTTGLGGGVTLLKGEPPAGVRTPGADQVLEQAVWREKVK